MRAIFLGLILILNANLNAQEPTKKVLTSPFASTVPGISIHNTHVVAQGQSMVLRGMRPLSPDDIKQLTDAGITQILIFRNDVPGEDAVSSEREWVDAELKIKALYEIPFKWKDIGAFKPACQQTIQALKIMRDSLLNEKSSLFFHCTVGEDRTGYLAGLFRLIFESKDASQVFQSEMCAYGYADGGNRPPDNIKPPHVVETVNTELTPVFLKMKELIDSGRISANNLDESACIFEPKISAQVLSQYRCKK